MTNTVCPLHSLYLRPVVTHLHSVFYNLGRTFSAYHLEFSNSHLNGGALSDLYRCNHAFM